MSEKDKDTAKTSKKTDANKSPIFRYTISEGYTVIFDLRQFLNDNEFHDHHNIKSFSFHSFKQISGMPVRTIKQSDQTISFKVPYLRDNDLYTKDNSGNDVSKKIDYSHTTIENLMQYGCHDALIQMDLQKIKDIVAEVAKIISYTSEERNTNPILQKLEEDIHQIQENMKVQNGYGIRLNELIANFVNTVEESIPEHIGGSGLSLKEEKTLLIAAAKQFQNIIKDKTATKSCKSDLSNQ
jgi:hypothetical protein